MYCGGCLEHVKGNVSMEDHEHICDLIQSIKKKLNDSLSSIQDTFNEKISKCIDVRLLYSHIDASDTWQKGCEINMDSLNRETGLCKIELGTVFNKINDHEQKLNNISNVGVTPEGINAALERQFTRVVSLINSHVKELLGKLDDVDESIESIEEDIGDNGETLDTYGARIKALQNAQTKTDQRLTELEKKISSPILVTGQTDPSKNGIYHANECYTRADVDRMANIEIGTEESANTAFWYEQFMKQKLRAGSLERKYTQAMDDLEKVTHQFNLLCSKYPTEPTQGGCCL